jgi:hypothetical protein
MMDFLLDGVLQGECDEEGYNNIVLQGISPD